MSQRRPDHQSKKPSGEPSREAIALTKNLVWYTMGVHAPQKIADFGAWVAAQDQILVKLLKDGSLKPSNWDATEVRINEEKLKPESERDMHKAYSWFALIKVDGHPREPFLKLESSKLVCEAVIGQGFCQPAVYCPPYVFNPERDIEGRTTLLDLYGGLHVPLKGAAVVTYFRRPGGYKSLPKATDFGDEVKIIPMGGRRVDSSKSLDRI